MDTPRETALLLSLLAGVVVSLGAAAGLLVLMATSRGFRRLAFLVATHAALALPLTAMHVAVFGAERNYLGLGGYVYLVSALALWALLAVALWPPRRPRPAPL